MIVLSIYFCEIYFCSRLSISCLLTRQTFISRASEEKSASQNRIPSNTIWYNSNESTRLDFSANKKWKNVLQNFYLLSLDYELEMSLKVYFSVAYNLIKFNKNFAVLILFGENPIWMAVRRFRLKSLNPPQRRIKTRNWCKFVLMRLKVFGVFWWKISLVFM